MPNNSLDCRVAGRIYAKTGDTVTIEWYPAQANLGLQLAILNKDCQVLDSVQQTGNGIFQFVPTYSGWHTIRLRNATASQAGQNCWVKAIYQAPQVVQTNEVKNKCACSISNGGNSATDDLLAEQIMIYPNPAQNELMITWDENVVVNSIQFIDLRGCLLKDFQGPFTNDALNCTNLNMEKGSYLVRINATSGSIVKPLQLN